MLVITSKIRIQPSEIELTAIAAQGSGGQNVNKVASAIHLRFDIQQSSLPQQLKELLLQSNDNRIGNNGILIIKAQRFRTQEKNRSDALARLREIIMTANKPTKIRRATRPTRNSQVKRVDSKTRRGQTKTLRRKVEN